MRLLLVLGVLVFYGVSAWGDNLIKTGGFEQPDYKYKPLWPRYFVVKGKSFSKDAFSFKRSNKKSASGAYSLFLSSSLPDGVNEVNGKIKVQPDKKYYLSEKFFYLRSSEKARASIRVSFYDKNHKLLGHRFSRPTTAIENKWTEKRFSFKTPQKTAVLRLTLWFAGNADLYLDDVYLSTVALPPQMTEDGNFLLNGDFESPDLSRFYIRHKSNSKNKLAVRHRRTIEIARNGKYSLRLDSDTEKGCNEININNVPFEVGKKYRFSADFYVKNLEGKGNISGRVIFFDKNQKVIRYLFPDVTEKCNAWNNFSCEFFPPAKTAKVNLTLWISGKYTIYLDNLFFGPVKNNNKSTANDEAEILSENSDLTLWKKAPYRQAPRGGMPQKKKYIESVRLSIAGNEMEPFQLLVTPKKALSNITIECSDLKNSRNIIIPSRNVTYRIIDFVKLEKTDNPALNGWHADPMLPSVPINGSPNRNLVFYIMTKVPAEQAPGIYKGMIKIKSGTKTLAKANLRVKVRNFSLPEQPYLKTFFYGLANPSWMRIDKRSRTQIHDDLMRNLKAVRISGNQALCPPVPEYTINNGKLIIKDWQPFDRMVKRYHLKYGMRIFNVINLMGDNSGWKWAKRFKHSVLTSEGRDLMGQYAALVQKHTRENFPDMEFYAYLYDEPPAKVYSQLKELLKTIKKYAPGFKIFITKTVSEELGLDNVHTWCVPFSPGLVKKNLEQKVRERGNDIWYYNWRARLDRERYINARCFAWQIFANDAVGGLLWQTIFNERGGNPWKTFGQSIHRAATLFYPPRGGVKSLIPSLRLYQIREAIDDFDYMKILENKINAKYPGAGTCRVKEIISELLPQLPFKIKNDSDLLYALRNRLADEIEAFESGPRIVITSTPQENSDSELSEIIFSIYAPEASLVTIGDKHYVNKEKQKKLKIKYNLPKFGLNNLKIVVRNKNKNYTFTRKYYLRKDPQLKQLITIAARLKITDKLKKEILSFCHEVINRNYTAKDIEQAQKLLKEAQKLLTERSINSFTVKNNKLAEAFFRKSQWAFSRQLFRRAQYYLQCAHEAKGVRISSLKKISISPVVFKGHFGLRLANNKINAVILETGGRLISFKVNGVECLFTGKMDNCFSELFRARQEVNPRMRHSLPEYGGFEDAGGAGAWPVSTVDWNIAIKEINSSKISIAFSKTLPGGFFKVEKLYTLGADSPCLDVNYTISNLKPKSFQSDDPETYQLAWRGRCMGGIGKQRKQSQENDILMVPGTIKLPERRFCVRQPRFYELRSIPLTAPYIGAFDSKEHTGFAILLDSIQHKHAYVWFSSRGNHKGGGKVYTLEIPRSFYGNRFNGPKRNVPFTVKPGEILTFKLRFLGIRQVKNEAQFLENIKQYI